MRESCGVCGRLVGIRGFEGDVSISLSVLILVLQRGGEPTSCLGVSSSLGILALAGEVICGVLVTDFWWNLGSVGSVGEVGGVGIEFPLEGEGAENSEILLPPL